MHNNPELSVMMSIYNNMAYLSEAIESILAQTFENFEFLITDDGSTDGSIEIIRYYANMDSRIIPIINSNNMGLGWSLNNMLVRIHAPYIARMDGDDVADAARFARQIDYMEQHKIDVCGTWCKIIGSSHQKFLKPPTNDADIKATLLFQSAFIDPSTIIRTAIIRKVGGYRAEADFAHDYDLWVRLIKIARMANIPDYLLSYRCHPGQVSRSSASIQWNAASNIRRMALKQCGIKASSEEQHIHGLIRYPVMPGSKLQIKTMEKWLMRLMDMFSGNDTMTQMIRKQWFFVCIRATIFGLWTYKTYCSSPLGIPTGIKLKSKVQMLLLCVMRIRYQSDLYNSLLRFSS